MENTAITTKESVAHEIVPIKEKLSFAFTNTGQTMIYGLFSMLMLYMTDYLGIDAAIAGLIITLTRIFDAINDPIMGQIVDRTKSRWGKCRPYMLFTPIPVALAAIAMFAPIGLTGAKAIPYAVIIYLIFTMIYTANDIPYWSMSSVITTDPKQRTSIVTLTRLIGSLGTGICVGGFWFVNKFFINYAGASFHNGFFFSAIVFCVIGAALMMQGFFFTKERAKSEVAQEKFFENIKLIPKSKPLVLLLIAGALYSVMAVGMTALTTYFVKWNVKEIFPNMSSVDIMSIYTPVIGFLPAIATVVGLLVTPFLIKKLEKRTILIASCSFGAIVNIASYFIGYSNIYLFIALRFFAFLPVGIWTSMTTILIGDNVDYLEYKTGKRVEGTCFSLLTFMGKFQNSISVAITGLVLSIVGYNGALNPDVTNQTPKALNGIFIMVTLISGLGYVLAMIPFLFYKLDKKTHLLMVEENMRRKALLEESTTAE
ncbi:MAG: MFS transporter [Clostridiales bacterium]|nr:MFS transporter [Clostridiales bacterium]